MVFHFESRKVNNAIFMHQCTASDRTTLDAHVFALADSLETFGGRGLHFLDEQPHRLLHRKHGFRPGGFSGIHGIAADKLGQIKKRPFSVLLFDEIEKAHVRILDKFLQILEDGRLTDGKGETVYFSETVIIFTSNIGASEVELQEDAVAVKKQFMEKVREHFVVVAKRPELLNRIGDNIVPFNFITGDDFLVAIARAKLQPLRERLKEKYRITDIVFDDEEKALKALAATVDRYMGGRGVLNEIVKRIIDPLAEFLFEEEEDTSLYAGRAVLVHQAADHPTFVFEMK